MSCLQVLLTIIFPPLAVIDRGCGSVLVLAGKAAPKIFREKDPLVQML